MRPRDWKDLHDTSCVIAIEIQWDRSRGALPLCQKYYIEKVLKSYNMLNCASMLAPIVESDKFGSFKSPRSHRERSNEGDSLLFSCQEGNWTISVKSRI